MGLIIKNSFNDKELQAINNFHSQVESQSPSNSFISLVCEARQDKVCLSLTINSVVLRHHVEVEAPSCLEALEILKKDFKKLIIHWLKNRKV